jgi:hypothetical protein
MSHIFISHSSRDGEQAARLLTWLHSHGFVETFLDFDKHAGLAPGSDWERTLYREIAASEAVILILTKNWFDSKWCFAEFTQARALGKAIFPLLETPTGEAFVSRDIQHLDLVKDREGGLAQPGGGVDRRGGQCARRLRLGSHAAALSRMLAFDEADAAIYFGRDDDIRRIDRTAQCAAGAGRSQDDRRAGRIRLGKILAAAGRRTAPAQARQAQLDCAPTFRPQLHPLEELAQAAAIALGPERRLAALARCLRARGSRRARSPTWPATCAPPAAQTRRKS